MKRKKRYTFIEKTYTRGGKFSFGLSAVAFVIMAIVILISVMNPAGVNMTGGAFGIISLMFAIYGFIVGLRSFSDTEGSPAFTIPGTIISGITIVVWLTLFLAGLR